MFNLFLQACDDGSIVTAHSSDDRFFILDTVNCKLLGVVGEADFKCLKMFEHVHFTTSGNVALFITSFSKDGIWTLQLYNVRDAKGIKMFSLNLTHSNTLKIFSFLTIYLNHSLNCF